MGDVMFVVFNGVKYYEVKNGNRKGYFESSTKDGKQQQLHRAIWESAYGELPQGWIVHHIDEDRRNNSIENLKAMSLGDHVNLHRPQFIDKQKAGASAFLTEVWRDKKRDPPNTLTCCTCGKAFYSYHHYAKYCSHECWNRGYYLKNKAQIDTRNKRNREAKRQAVARGDVHG